jgi:hypothetical protein
VSAGGGGLIEVATARLEASSLKKEDEPRSRKEEKRGKCRQTAKAA